MEPKRSKGRPGASELVGTVRKWLPTGLQSGDLRICINYPGGPFVKWGAEHALSLEDAQPTERMVQPTHV